MWPTKCGRKPSSAGNRHLGYKESLNTIEAMSPGSKHAFYDGFLKRLSPTLVPTSAAELGELQPCIECGAPTTSDICAFCRIAARASAHAPVPIEVHLRKGRGRPKPATATAGTRSTPSYESADDEIGTTA